MELKSSEPTEGKDMNIHEATGEQFRELSEKEIRALATLFATTLSFAGAWAIDLYLNKRKPTQDELLFFGIEMQETIEKVNYLSDTSNNFEIDDVNRLIDDALKRNNKFKDRKSTR